MKRASVVMLMLGAVACSSAPKPAATPAAVEVEPEVPAEPAEPPLPELTGDDQIAEPWRARFRAWLRDQPDAPYTEVLRADAVANAVTVVVTRRVEAEGECREGPSRVTITQDEGATPSVDLVDFGDDCCADTTCVATPASWQLRFLKAFTAKDWNALSLLAPAKKPLVARAVVSSSEDAPQKTTRAWKRKDIAAGKFADGPGCDLVYSTLACGPLDKKGKSFTCTCDGGGYHVEYVWQKEGSGFVLAKTDEQSH